MIELRRRSNPWIAAQAAKIRGISMKAAILAGMTALAGLAATPAVAQDHVALVTEYVNANVMAWATDPTIIDALKEAKPLEKSSLR